MRIPTTAVARTLIVIGVSACAAGLSGQAIASADTPNAVIAQRVEALNHNAEDPTLYTAACWAHAKPPQRSYYVGVPAAIDDLDIFVDGNDATVSYAQGIVQVRQHWVLRAGHWLLDC